MLYPSVGIMRRLVDSKIILMRILPAIGRQSTFSISKNRKKKLSPEGRGQRENIKVWGL